MNVRTACAAAVVALLLAGCTSPISGAPVPGSSSAAPSYEPTDPLSDSTAYFTVEVNGRARIAWTDGDGVNTEDVDAGNHRYGTDSWQAGDLSVVTAVPLDDASAVSCRAETSDQWPKLTATDHASGPDEVAVCWAGEAPYSPQPGRRKQVVLAADSTSGHYDVVARTPYAITTRSVADDRTRLRTTTSGLSMVIAVSRLADATVECSITRGSTKRERTGHGLGGVAVCTLGK